MSRICLLVLACALASLPVDGASERGIEEVNIFVVDTGWKLTVDDYFEYEVNYILDSVVTALSEDPMRKFIEVEIAFFERWWKEQSTAKKEQVKGLVKARRLVFVGGGWCMHDEAVTTYVAQINQLTEGHMFILEHFGEDAIPSVAWHIDPFGASNMSPGLFSEAAYEAFVIDRVDYRLKSAMKQNQTLEFVWQGIASLGASAEMFTHVLDSFYTTPRGFDWEHGVSQILPLGDGPPVVITQQPSYITKTNVRRRALEFIEVARKRARYFRTNNVLIPFGSDFNFQNANMKYKNMDKLINYINEHQKELRATAQYSTLDDYFDAVHAEGLQWNVTDIDFFPYIDRDTSYWTGFYTSRPNVKQASRQADAWMRSFECFFATANACQEPGSLKSSTCPASGLNLNGTGVLEQMQYLRRATALVQHHDGVTGTERVNVAQDYLDRLNHGVESAAVGNNEILGEFYGNGTAFSIDSNSLASVLNSGQEAVVSIYNSLEWTLADVVMIPIPIAVTVSDGAGNPLPFQVSDAYTFGSEQPLELFVEVNAPPLGFTSIVLAPSTSLALGKRRTHTALSTEGEIILSNDFLSVSFDSNGALSWMNTTLFDTAMNQIVGYYTPADKLQTSGAYIFRPDPDVPFTPIALCSIESQLGPLVQEVRQTFCESNITVISRLYEGRGEIASVLRQDTHVGPIESQVGGGGGLAHDGREIVQRISSDLASGSLFYTDNNGMEMQTRQRNLTGRPGDADAGVAMAGNYYPIVSRMFIRDEGQQSSPRQLTVLTGHSHGGSSLAQGELELMLHRRLFRNDIRGVGRPLDDTSEVTVRTMLFVSPVESAARRHRVLANVLQYPLTLSYSATQTSTAMAEFTPLCSDLPENVRIITLKMLNATSSTALLRVMNIFAKGEDPVLSQPVTIDLTTIFCGINIENVSERTLTGALPIEARAKRRVPHSPRRALDPTDVVLQPMQIRTFWVSIVRGS